MLNPSRSLIHFIIPASVPDNSRAFRQFIVPHPRISTAAVTVRSALSLIKCRRRSSGGFGWRICVGLLVNHRFAATQNLQLVRVVEVVHARTVIFQPSPKCSIHGIRTMVEFLKSFLMSLSVIISSGQEKLFPHQGQRGAA